MTKYQHSLADGDPAEVTVRDAATVMVVADRPDLEVLMVQRTARAAFGPQAWVFPGGRVDPADREGCAGVIAGRTDSECSAMLEVAAGGSAWWVAAVRETIEEAGLAVAMPQLPRGGVEPLRAASARSSAEFLRELADVGLVIDLTKVDEVARFVTPVGPPRRFDTRFFVAVAPEDQSVSADESEVTRAQWIRPADAITAWRADEFPLMSVTHRMLACLARYESAEAVIGAAAERRAARRIRVNDPNGAYEVLLPGEPGYETADLEIEHGWVRL